MLLSPAYTALRLWEPPASVFSVKLATLEIREAVPMVVAPSIKTTLPVGVNPVTVAVKVVAVPAVLGFRLEANVVEVGTPETVWASAVEVAAALLPSPAYTAAMVWVPIASVVLVYEATPPASVAAPSVLAPSLKVTAPEGVAPLTVAVNVTEAPKIDGVPLEVKVTELLTVFTVCVNVGEVLDVLLESPP